MGQAPGALPREGLQVERAVTSGSGSAGPRLDFVSSWLSEFALSPGLSFLVCKTSESVQKAQNGQE